METDTAAPAANDSPDAPARVDWAPVVVAAVVASALLLSTAFRLAVSVWLDSRTQEPAAGGAELLEPLRPAGVEIALGVGVPLAVVAVGLGLLLLTWRLARRQRRTASWVAAAAAVVVAFVGV